MTITHVCVASTATEIPREINVTSKSLIVGSWYVLLGSYVIVGVMGDPVGAPVVGEAEGETVGETVGESVGTPVMGDVVGLFVGEVDGAPVGATVRDESAYKYNSVVTLPTSFSHSASNTARV